MSDLRLLFLLINLIHFLSHILIVLFLAELSYLGFEGNGTETYAKKIIVCLY